MRCGMKVWRKFLSHSRQVEQKITEIYHNTPVHGQNEPFLGTQIQSGLPNSLWIVWFDYSVHFCSHEAAQRHEYCWICQRKHTKIPRHWSLDSTLSDFSSNCGVLYNNFFSLMIWIGRNLKCHLVPTLLPSAGMPPTSKVCWFFVFFLFFFLSREFFMMTLMGELNRVSDFTAFFWDLEGIFSTLGIRSFSTDQLQTPSSSLCHRDTMSEPHSVHPEGP